jgi:hypothetical protein
MEKKKTALEFYEEQWDILVNGFLNDKISMTQFKKLFDQCKEMEKNQIEDAYDMGYLDYQNLTYDSAQEYFKDIYGGNNE